MCVCKSSFIKCTQLQWSEFHRLGSFISSQDDVWQKLWSVDTEGVCCHTRAEKRWLGYLKTVNIYQCYKLFLASTTIFA